MRISKDWLSDYIDLCDLSFDSFEELITTRVAEVDVIETVGAPIAKARICRIDKVESHPSRENLKICQVSLGDASCQVVCGAQNVTADMFSVFLPVGAEVSNPNGEGRRIIEERDISGIKSKGMLVSEAELGISGEHQGIIKLPETKNLRVGEKAEDVFGKPDTVLVIDNKSLTHRPDLWGHLGFARELSAILKRPLKNNPDRFADDTKDGRKLFEKLGGKGKSPFSIEIQTNSGCRRFAALLIENVSQQPSPLWLRRRLYAVNAGVRSLLIDLSNYVMHDIGQPNHAYDADLLQGDIVSARLARQNEKFLALDGAEYELSPEDIVITDAEGVVALGGIIGGKTCSVQDSTKRLLLESANFDPIRVRVTAKRHQLRTDASNRFEKSLSAYAVPLAIQRFVEILSSIDGKVKLSSPIAEAFVEKPKSITVPVKFDYLRSRLGVSLEDSVITDILTGLQFGVQKLQLGSAVFSVPYYRSTRDIEHVEDLVEEVGRIYGYENVPEVTPEIHSIAAPRDALRDFENSIRDLLLGAGFSEVSNYSFMEPIWAEKLGVMDMQRTVKLRNPTDAQADILRTSLVPGMLRCLQKNLRHNPLVLCFELGRSYESTQSALHGKLKFRSQYKNPAGFERRLLSVCYTSGLSENSLKDSTQPPVTEGAEFYALMGVLQRVVSLVAKTPLELRTSVTKINEKSEDYYLDRQAWMHPYRTATVFVNNICVGVIAEVCPGLLEELKERAVVAEIDLELLLEADNVGSRFKPIAVYPDSFFEMSVVMPERTQFRELEHLVKSNVPLDLLRAVDVLAVYKGKPLSEGEKSVSIKLSFGSDDHTLSSDELSALQNSLMTAVNKSSFSLRS